MRKRKNSFIIMVLVLAVLSTGIGVGAVEKHHTAQKVEHTVCIDDTVVKLSAPVMSIDNRTYVPLREWCEKINCEVVWNEQEEKVEIFSKNPENDIIANVNPEGKRRSIEHFYFLEKDMDMKEIYKRVGNPHYWRLAYIMMPVYYIDDTTTLILHQDAYSKLYRVQLQFKDGTTISLEANQDEKFFETKA